MLRERSSLRGLIPLAPADPRRHDLAMEVLQYGIAMVAIGVAILLTAFR
jgi:hypothetical protein